MMPAMSDPARLRLPWLTLLRRFLFVATFALWMGGFTFYGSVVVPIGARVVSGGEAEFGFVTRQVSNWLNLVGGLALLVFLWDLFTEWRGRANLIRWGRLSLWAGMLACHLALLLMHPGLDRMLDPETQTILARARFHALHKSYLKCSTVQWTLALAFLALTMIAWLNGRRSPATSVAGDSR
jgi:hypothetical protein